MARLAPSCALRLLLGMLLLVEGGCGRAVLKVVTEPGDAHVEVNKRPGRGDRWTLPAGSPVDIVATWPEGEVVRATMMHERDVEVILRRDGDPDQVTPGWLLAAQGPRGRAHLGGPILRDPAATSTPAVPPPVTAEETPEDPFDRARKLYEDGQKAFELADYDLAIDRFKEAYEVIRGAPSPDTAEILTNVIFNLAVVYEKSYELHPEEERLRKARIMYRQYEEQMNQLVDDWGRSDEASEIRARVRAIEARLGDGSK